MKEECLICKQPLEYLKEDILMECAICHKKENSKTRCMNGHYVCSGCHTQGMDSIIGLCLHEHSKNPIEIMEKMMSLPFCHMHGPEHHVMVGAALLTAYHNAGGELALEKALLEMYRRGKEVPGGACGFWGACGAGISTGMYMSIITQATPLATKAWGLSNQMTAKSLARIGEAGGPRCCKRDSYFSIMEAVKFTAENLGVHMETEEFFCTRSNQNNQCKMKACPFHGENTMSDKTKMSTDFHIHPVKNDSDIHAVAALAEKIWNQHFTPIIGKAQVAYMVNKFQSYEALKNQIGNEGYEYFGLFCEGELAGYTGIHQEADRLFLSKLYIHQSFRGRHLATKTMNFLKELCKERGLQKIWLTCNKHNDNTLKVYKHLGFCITDAQVADIGNGFVMDDYILTLNLPL